MSFEVPVLKKLSQKGQGVVEYILLVVIIISFALAISARLFKPFNDWAKNYIGDYIYCLLDQGELPGLGGAESVQECDKGFAEFTPVAGRPSNASGSEEGAGANKYGSGSSRAGAGDVVSASRRGRRGSALGEGFDNGATNRSNVIDLGAAGSSSQRTNRFYTSYGSGPSGPQKVVQSYGLTGLMAREAERIKKREDKITTIARSESPQGFVKGRAKKFGIELPKARDRSEVDLGNVSIPWGEWLRSLLIVVIIIVLVLFVAGQLLQISKSMEKE